MSSPSFILFGTQSGFEVFEYSEKSFSRMIGAQLEPIISPIHQDKLLVHLHNEYGVSYLKIYTRAKGINNSRPGGLIGVGLMSTQGILRLSDKNTSILIGILDKLRKLVSINEVIQISTFKEFDPTKLGVDFNFSPDTISIPSNNLIKDNSSVLITKNFSEETKNHSLIDKLCQSKHLFVFDSIEVLNSEINNSHKIRFRDSIYMFSNNGNELIPFKEAKIPIENPTIPNPIPNPPRQSPTDIPSKPKSQDSLNPWQSQVHLLTRQLDEEKKKYEKFRSRSHRQRNLLLSLLSCITFLFFYISFSENADEKPPITVIDDGPPKPQPPTDTTLQKDSTLTVIFDSLIKNSDGLQPFLKWYKIVSDTTISSKDSADIKKREKELSKINEFIIKAQNLGIDTVELHKRIKN